MRVFQKCTSEFFLGYNRTFIIERYAQCQKWAESLNCKNLGCKSSKNARQNQSRAGTKKLDGKGDFCIRSHPGKFSPPRNVELLKIILCLCLNPNYRWKIKTEQHSKCLKGGQLVGQLSDQTNATKANPPSNFGHKQIFDQEYTFSLLSLRMEFLSLAGLWIWRSSQWTLCEVKKS